jgi:hypothetical protein
MAFLSDLHITIKKYFCACMYVHTGNTKRGSITVLLTCLTGLELAV